MNIRLVNDEYEEIALIENKDTLYNTLQIANSINEFIIDSFFYKKSNDNINLNLNAECIEIFVEES